MKKLLTILLATLMLFTLVGCGSKEEETVATGSGDWKFTNVNIRKAMSYAIDREALVTSLKDGSVAAQGIVPISLASNPETGEDYRSEVGVLVGYDLEKAKEFYAKGCEELGVKSVSVDLLYGTNEGDSVIKAAEQIAYYLEEAGFEVNLVSKQKKERLAMAGVGDFEVMLTRWGPDYGDPQTYMDLYTSWNYDNNYGHWASDKYDELVLAAEAAVEPIDRWNNFVAAEGVLITDEMGVVPVFQAGGAMIIRPGVENVEFHSAAVDIYRHATGKDTITFLTNTDVLSWDTGVATDGTSFSSIAEFISGLFEMDAAGNPVPDLCESYELSDDQLTYTFKLRDAKWSNGAPVTANDFVFSWDRLVDDATASEYSWWMSDVMTAESWTAIDDKTLELKVSKPNGLILQALTFPVTYPINEEFFNSCNGSYASGADTLLSCGPYKLDTWTPGYSFEFSLNDSYWNADTYKAAPSKVVFRVLGDTQTALMEYDAGNIDTVVLSGEQVPANVGVPGYMERLQGYLFYLQINVDNNIAK